MPKAKDKPWKSVQPLLDVGVQVLMDNERIVLRHDGSATQVGACQAFTKGWPAPPAVQPPELRKPVAGGFDPLILWSQVEALIHAGVLVNFSATEIELVYFDAITGLAAQNFDSFCASEYPALNVTTRLFFAIPAGAATGGVIAALTPTAIRAGMLQRDGTGATTLTMINPPAALSAIQNVDAKKINLHTLEKAGLLRKARGGSSK